MGIIVNGVWQPWIGETITYSEVVELAGRGPSKLFTVQFSHGPIEKQRGTLVPGESAKVRGGMRFDVTWTGSA